MQQPLNRLLLLQPVWLPTVLFIPLLYALGWLAAVPLTLIGLPTDQLSLTGTVLSFVLFLLVMPRWAALRWSASKPWEALGIRNSSNDNRPPSAQALLQGFLIATGLVTLITSLILLGGWGRWLGGINYTTLINATLLCLGVGFAEELIFRSWLYQELSQIVSSRQAEIVQAIIFSLAHTRFNLETPEILGLSLGLFLLGLVLGKMRQRNHGCLWQSIGFHGGLVGIWFILNQGIVDFLQDTPYWLVGPGGQNPNPIGGPSSWILLTLLLINRNRRIQ